MFSEHEAAYLRSQPLLRLATVAANGQPDADAVQGYRTTFCHHWDGNYR